MNNRFQIQQQARASSQGAVLPSVLGVLILILVVGSQLTETVTLQHKTNNAFKAQISAESLADFGLNSAEEALLALETRPQALRNIEPTTGANMIDRGLVWAQSLNNYNLTAQQDALSGEPLGWERQPSDWWETYSNSFSRNISATQSQTAYSIVEEFDADFSDSDLGQERDHFTGPTKTFYQITARGEGGTFGTSRVRSIYARTFR